MISPSCKSPSIVVDVAVLCKEYSNIDITCNSNHVINLDEVEISAEKFKSIFYPYGENFGIDCNKCNTVHDFFYITFLNVSRNCFTTCSLIELSNDLSKIKTLCDINGCSLLCSLTWSNIISMLNDYNLADSSVTVVSPLFVVNVVFKTPNPNVKPTTVKFNYRISHISCV